MPHVERLGAPDTGSEGPRLEADIDRLLAEHAPPIQAIERALRARIRDELPGVAEQVDFGNRLLAFGHSMKMRELLFSIIAHASFASRPAD